MADLSPAALLENGDPASTPKALSVLKTVTYQTVLNDVYFCATEDAGYLAVAANSGPGEAKVQPGSVTIYSRYVRGQESDSDGSLKELAKFTVGKLMGRKWGGGNLR